MEVGGAGGGAAMADAPWLALGVLAWSTGFAAVRLFFRKRPWGFCNRCVSMIHVFVSIFLCSASVKDWSRPLDGISGPSTVLHRRAITTSLAYFIYDFFCGLLDFPIDYSNAAHHLITVFGLGYGFYLGTCGPELVACLWLMELSNPFMHAREILKEFGVKDKPVNLVNDLIFVIVFTFARLIVGPFVTYTTVMSRSPVGVKCGAVGIQVVSIFWFYKIARMVMYKVNKAKKGTSSSSSARSRSATRKED